MALTVRYVRADAAGSGDGTTNTNSGANGAWTLAEGITNEAAGMLIHVKAGTYASTTTTRTFAAVGTTTAPIWWKGFNNSPGDLDTDYATAKPAWTFTTGRVNITGAHHIFSNLNIQGAPTTNALVALSGSFGRTHRCRIENTGTNANSRAVTASTGVGMIIDSCWLKATSSATSVINASTGTGVYGCDIVGGGHGIDVMGSPLQACFNVFRSVGGDGIQVTSGTIATFLVLNNTFYGSGSDGVEFVVIPTQIAAIIGNIFANNGGYGINNSSGTNTNIVMRAYNSYYSNTSGTESGFGDSPSYNDVTESGSPFTNAGSGDLTLISAALSKAAGIPGLFENESYSSYLDIGAIQRQEAGGAVGYRIRQRLAGT